MPVVIVGNTSCHFSALMRGPIAFTAGMAKHRHEIVVFKDFALDLLGQLLALVAVERTLILLELRVEVLHADTCPALGSRHI